MKTRSGSHAFTLVLSGFSQLDDEVADNLFEAGCGDALLGTRGGVSYLDFDRKGTSFLDAVLSAIEGVKRAGIEVLRVEPDDLVSAAEIARRTGRSPQNIHQLIRGDRGRGGFPPPISSLRGPSPLWRWVDVVEWIREHEGNVSPARHSAAGQLSEKNARAIASINDVLALRRHREPAEDQEKIFRHLMPSLPGRARRAANKKFASRKN